MNAYQEPKYKVVDFGGGNLRLVNRQSNEAIPDDEPVFVFRARDPYAIAALRHYSTIVDNAIHSGAVSLRIAQFDKWANEHGDRMRSPDSQVTADWRLDGPP